MQFVKNPQERQADALERIANTLEELKQCLENSNL